MTPDPKVPWSEVSRKLINFGAPPPKPLRQISPNHLCNKWAAASMKVGALHSIMSHD